jgi:Tfp pilus assembly protein PilO
MKKVLWMILIGILNLWYAWAYVTIDESDAAQIEKQINSTVDLTLEQKKEKSKMFYSLARKSYEIRKAFTYATNTVPWVELSW